MSFTVLGSRLRYTGLQQVYIQRGKAVEQELTSIIPCGGQLVKLSEDRHTAKWTQASEGVPVYGSLLTLHHNKAGKYDQQYCHQTIALLQ